MCTPILGHDHHTGGILVQAVHNSGAMRILTRLQIRAVRQQPVDQGAVGMPGRRMHHQTSGFIQDDHLRVFVKDIERHRLRGISSRFPFWWATSDNVSQSQAIGRLALLLIDDQRALADELRRIGPRMARQ